MALHINEEKAFTSLPHLRTPYTPFYAGTLLLPHHARRTALLPRTACLYAATCLQHAGSARSRATLRFCLPATHAAPVPVQPLVTPPLLFLPSSRTGTFTADARAPHVLPRTRARTCCSTGSYAPLTGTTFPSARMTYFPRTGRHYRCCRFGSRFTTFNGLVTRLSTFSSTDFLYLRCSAPLCLLNSCVCARAYLCRTHFLPAVDRYALATALRYRCCPLPPRAAHTGVSLPFCYACRTHALPAPAAAW